MGGVDSGRSGQREERTSGWSGQQEEWTTGGVKKRERRQQECGQQQVDIRSYGQRSLIDIH